MVTPVSLSLESLSRTTPEMEDCVAGPDVLGSFFDANELIFKVIKQIMAMNVKMVFMGSWF
jgi:hypothetical protein